MNPIIQINGLCAGYDGKTVLNQVDLAVYEKDFLGIIGPNGGGKTTLIKCILGLHHPLQGHVRFYKNGQEVSEITMGYLPQYNNIDKKFPISVYEVVLSGLSKQKSLFRRYSKEQHEQARQMIVRMGLEGLEGRSSDLGPCWDEPWFRIRKWLSSMNRIRTSTNVSKPSFIRYWKKSTKNVRLSWSVMILVRY